MNKDNENYYLDILKQNKGFSIPGKWVIYARDHKFQKVDSNKLNECPNCGSKKISYLNQYVYYSTLICLDRCQNCDLIFSDTHLSSVIIKNHFENAYKNDEYFLKSRRKIFSQVVNLVVKYAPLSGKIIDIGGAKGHLICLIEKSRPDLSCVVNDLSQIACDFAESEFKIRTIRGSLTDLVNVQEKFDVILLIDVIYYEPNIVKLWHVLQSLTKDRGTIIMRVPNTYLFMKYYRLIKILFQSKEKREMTTQIPFFNPEHLYVFSKKYLIKQFSGIGFNDIQFLPSELLEKNIISSLFFWFAIAVHYISLGKIVITPSQFIVANKVK